MSDEKHASANVARTADGTDQANTLTPVPRYHIKGKLYYKRKWDYNTAADTEKFKEYLPGAKVELHLQLRGSTKFDKVGSGAELSEEGEFVFTDVPACTKIGLKIYLENKRSITTIKGNENLVDKPDYQLKTGKVVWRRIELDMKKITDATSPEVDFGEGSVQCALWDMHKTQAIDFKTGFWKAFSHTGHKASTIFELYENWKSQGCPDIDELKAALKKFNLHTGYRYTRKLKHGDKSLDPAAPAEFKTVDELYDAYGKEAGGTLASYSDEFYNRNRYVGGGAFQAGATVGSYKLVKGTTYIVPERFEIK